jgi:hypothetical protein
MTLLELEQACARARTAGAIDEDTVQVSIGFNYEPAIGLWFREVNSTRLLCLHDGDAMPGDV